MLLIKCPWCGERAETEFSCGGEAGINDLPDPDAERCRVGGLPVSFARTRGRPQGTLESRQGCRRWFGVERDTVTYMR